MKLILSILILIFYAQPVWAYVDPGFGGYLFNTVISWIMTGFTFVCAAVIYFFHTFLGRGILSIWRKYEKACLIVLLSILGAVSFFLGSFAHHTFASPRPHDPPSTRIIDGQRMSPGYALYNGNLIDATGKVLNRWPGSAFGVLDKNGDYYGQLSSQYAKGKYYKEAPWGRFSWDHKIIWEKDSFIHHEIYLSPQGTVFTFTKENHRYNHYKVDFDVILEFAKNGRQLQRYSLWDHLKDLQPYHAPFIIDGGLFPAFLVNLFHWEKPYENPARGAYDYFHLNSLVTLPPNPLEGKNPAFRRGNWLISLFHGSMIVILDQDTKKVLWHAAGNDIPGGLQGQHAVSMLADGNILVFDNGIDRKGSRILVIDPLTLGITWEYRLKNFFSPWQGFVQALPNGNFLVTESTKGRAFELTPDKKIVWEYDSHNESGIYRMVRYPQEMIGRILRQRGENAPR